MTWHLTQLFGHTRSYPLPYVVTCTPAGHDLPAPPAPGSNPLPYPVGGS
jgi:hypothetical protein